MVPVVYGPIHLFGSIIEFLGNMLFVVASCWCSRGAADSTLSYRLSGYGIKPERYLHLWIVFCINKSLWPDFIISFDGNHISLV